MGSNIICEHGVFKTLCGQCNSAWSAADTALDARAVACREAAVARRALRVHARAWGRARFLAAADISGFDPKVELGRRMAFYDTKHHTLRLHQLITPREQTELEMGLVQMEAITEALRLEVSWGLFDHA